MAQIGFTEKQEHVYDRFQKMRLAYQAKNGRTYAPGFLTVLMDAWEQREVVLLHKAVGQYMSNIEYDETALYEYTLWLSKDIKSAMRFKSSESAIEYLSGSEQNVKEWEVVDFLSGKPENTPVTIKQSDGALYLQSSSVATANFFMTHDRSEAMVFDSPDQAKTFLRQSGRELGEWIIEPVNQTL